MENDNKGNWSMGVVTGDDDELDCHSADSPSSTHLARTWFLNDLEIAVR